MLAVSVQGNLTFASEGGSDVPLTVCNEPRRTAENSDDTGDISNRRLLEIPYPSMAPRPRSHPRSGVPQDKLPRRQRPGRPEERPSRDPASPRPSAREYFRPALSGWDYRMSRMIHQSRHQHVEPIAAMLCLEPSHA